MQNNMKSILYMYQIHLLHTWNTYLYVQICTNMLAKTSNSIKNKLNYTNYIKLHKITVKIHQIYIKYMQKQHQNRTEQEQNKPRTGRSTYLDLVHEVDIITWLQNEQNQLESQIKSDLTHYLP